MSKSLTIFSNYKMYENEVTKALMDLMRFSDQQLTELFITQCLGIPLQIRESKQEAYYDFQVSSQLKNAAGNGYIVAISDEKKLRARKAANKVPASNDSVPDAVIQIGNVTLLIESKVEGNSIDDQQLIDHERKFAVGETIQRPAVRISWQKIHKFFQTIFDDSDLSWGQITKFLMGQYMDYCQSMGLAFIKDDSYILSKFNHHPRVKQLILEIDQYLMGKEHVRRRDEITGKITMNFGYVIIRKNGTPTQMFFESTIYKKGYFILHLVYSNVEFWQLKADMIFPGNARANNKKNEVQINMFVVDSFEKIKEFLEEAYGDRMTKANYTGWKKE